MSLPLPLPEAPPQKLPYSADTSYLLDTLTSYKREAEDNRRSGMNPRDEKWRQNLDLYWNRYDFSTKADWQSKNVMPEVPSYVDRFAAAIKDAWVQNPTGNYIINDPYDTEQDLGQYIKRMTDVWLSQCGMNQIGTPLDFSAVLEEQMKMGALMNCSGVVVWRDDVPGGRVSFETVDPRNVYLDHTYRNLYRIRRTEIDRADLARMLDMKTNKGNSVFNIPEMSNLVQAMTEETMRKKELSGSGEEVISDREPIVMDEYVATVIGPDGKLLMDDELIVVANDKFIVRGPEKKPYMHGKDWLVYTPLVTVPLSPYGRSYMEDFGSMAKVFTDLTNLILDATYAASMKAYVMVPSMLADPTQANTGIWPNKTFMLEEGFDANAFAAALELGSLDQGAIQVWNAIKSELSDAAGMNEIGLGQLPDKTHIAATAVAGAQQSSSAILRSVAQTVETRFIDPALDLVWKTGLQHARLDDKRMANAVGPEMYAALLKNRKELISRPITFQARGISGLIQRQQKLSALMNVMQVIAQNENLVAAFMKVVDISKLLELLFQLSNVDLNKLTQSQRQQMIQQAVQPMQDAGQRGTPSPAGMSQMNDLATQMGVAQ